MPFITEEIWQLLIEREEGESLMVNLMPEAKKYNKEIVSAFEPVKETISAIRTIRKEKNIPNKEKLELLIRRNQGEAGIDFLAVITKLCNLSAVSFVSEKQDGAASFMIGTTEYYVPLNGNLDIEAELEKISEELKYHIGFLANVMKKLDNERFVSNAPANVLEFERKKRSDAEMKIKSLEERKRELGKQ